MIFCAHDTRGFFVIFMSESSTSLIKTGQEMLWDDDQMPRELRDLGYAKIISLAPEVL